MMGRRVPNDNISLIEPFVYFSFSFVGLVASISLITFLCSVGFRRKKTPELPIASPEPSETKALNAYNLSSTVDAAAMSPEPPRMSEVGISDFAAGEDNNEVVTKELPLPPSMQAKNMSMNMSCSMNRDTSMRRTSFSLSMKMPKSLSMAKNRDNEKEENEGGKKGKLKKDDSVWMKTIILGEKCVPDEEEEEAIIYEGKGKRISFSAYHPRQSTSMSISRQCSFIDHDALCASQTQYLEERI